MFTIKPLDTDAVEAAAKETGAIVTAENHNVNGGLGSAVAEYLVEHLSLIHIFIKASPLHALYWKCS